MNALEDIMTAKEAAERWASLHGLQKSASKIYKNRSQKISGNVACNACWDGTAIWIRKRKLSYIF